MSIENFDRTDVLTTLELMSFTGFSISSIYKKVSSHGFPESIIVNNRAYWKKSDVEN